MESSTVCNSGDVNCYCTNGSFQQGVRDCLNNNGCGDELQGMCVPSKLQYTRMWIWLMVWVDGINLENLICGSS